MQIKPFYKIIELYNEKIKDSQDFFQKLENEKTEIKTIKIDFDILEQITDNYLDQIITY